MASLKSSPDNVTSISIEELFSLEELQRMQDQFARSTGLASIITRPDGTPITAPSNFTRMCQDIIRRTKKGAANCCKSDANFGTPNPGGPVVQQCLSSGLWDAGAGIVVGEQHIANWLIGQVRDEAQTEEKMRAYAREIGADEISMIEAFGEVPVMSREKFEQVAQMLFTFARHLSASAYQNMQQARLISDLKRSEIALAESELKYRVLANSGQALIWTSGPDKLCDYFNEPWLLFTGKTLEQEIGNGWLDGVHPEDLDRCLQIYTTAFDKREKFSMEYRLRHNSGEYHWVQDDGTPRFDIKGKFLGYIGHCLDITERKQADMELFRAKELYHSLVENSHSIIHTVSPEGILNYVSPSITRLLGYDPSDFIGKHFRDTLHPEDVAACEAFQNEMLSTGRAREGIEYRVFHRDGSIHWLMSNFMPYLNDKKEIISFVGNAIDITEQKKNREELDVARKAAEESCKIKSEFLALVSHEIRTPLNALVGFSSLARKTADPVILQQYLDIIDQSSRSLMDLVNDILDMSKIEAGQLSLESIPFNLIETIDLIVWQNATLAAQKKIDVQVFKDKSLPTWTSGDPIRFRQILSNLIANAFKFTEAGSITLTVTSTEESLGKNNHMVRIEVQDTGIGIAEDQIPLLFQPFLQLDSSTKRKYGGTGLGLAIVKRLVKLMQGRIEVTSEEGKGSCFVVELPLPISSPPSYKKIAIPTVDHLNILIIEDNTFNLRLLSDTLIGWGHKVTQAANASQALELARQCNYDFIILDIRMPDMDGIELASRLRRREKALNVATVPIIAYTADTEGATREQCFAAGMNAVLYKPLDPEKLALTISEHCNQPVTAQNPAVIDFDIRCQVADCIVADMGHDSKQLQAYWQLLRDDIEYELDALAQAVLIGDRSLLQKSAHSLKGFCGYLKNQLPSELAIRLNDGALTLPIKELQNIAKQLRSIFIQLIF